MSRRIWTVASRMSAMLVTGVLVATTAVPAAARGPRDEQWYLDQIGIERAHAVTTGKGILVGMFLSMVNTEHPDLGGRVRPRQTVTVDNTVKPLTGRRAFVGGGETALAGLVVAGGGSGILGVAPGAEIQPIDSPTFSEEDESLALRWLVDQGARVINMTGVNTPNLRRKETWDGVRYALAKDVVVIVSESVVHGSPAAISAGILVVNGVDRDGKREEVEEDEASNSRVNLSAPGLSEFIALTDDPAKGAYWRNPTGSNANAAAIVTGVAALIRSKYPDLNAPSVINRLLSTAKDVGPPGPDPTYGYGIVDAAAAVTADIPPVTKNPLGDPPRVKDDSRLWLAGMTLVPLACIAGVALVVTLLVVVLRSQRRRRLRSS
ncbi:hypothetical protein GCM10027290_20350 [Micromonospora sonneratiae]|uniref:S8 family serine peptidase n=1 Tax=Micromonospora sonneratiae TaxID=1184706 RepID=A0ABW3YIZ8_9ACTN